MNTIFLKNTKYKIIDVGHCRRVCSLTLSTLPIPPMHWFVIQPKLSNYFGGAGVVQRLHIGLLAMTRGSIPGGTAVKN